MDLKLKDIMLDLSSNIFLALNYDYKLLDFNQKANVLFVVEKPLGQDLELVLKPYIFNAIKFHMSKSSKDRLPVSFVIDIDQRIHECKIYPYSFGFVICFEDINETRECYQLVSELSKRLELTQQVTQTGYFEMDMKDKSTFFSDEIRRLLGVSKRAKGNIITEYIHDKDLHKYVSRVKKLVETGKSFEIRLRFVRKDSNSIIHCLLRAGMNCDNNCKVVGTIQDLTGVIESRKKLLVAKSEAERLSKARSYFIAQASHDLRQPIQAMRMFMHSLMSSKFTDKQRESIDNVSKSVENLTYLLDNLMELSKLDYGGEVYVPHSFDLFDLVTKISNEFDIIAKEKKINFEVKSCHLEMYNSSFFIERIIRNLLNNAFKFTKDKISIDVNISDENLVIIKILDNGCGIKSSEIKYIFDEFFQSKHIKRDISGMGLGLPIAKKMAELVGAKIYVNSKFNKYTEICVEIPKIKRA